MRKHRGSRSLCLLVVTALSALCLTVVAPSAQAEVEVRRTAFPNGLSGVAVDPGDGSVYVEEFASTARVHKIQNGTIVATTTLSGGSGRLAYDAVRHRVYVTQQAEGRVVAIDSTTMSVVGSVTVGGTPVGIEVDSVSGKVAVALNQTGQLKVLDGPSLSTLATVAAGSGAIYLAIAPGGDTVFVSNQVNSVTRHEAPSYASTGSFGANAPNEMVIDPVTSRLYLGTQNEGVVVVDTSTLARVGSVPLSGRALDLTLTGSGSRLVAAMTDQSHLSVIDTATLTLTGVVGNVPNPVFMATNTADDHVFAAGGDPANGLIEVAPSTPPDQLPVVSVNDGIVIEGDPAPPNPSCHFFCYQDNSHPQPVLITLHQPSSEWVKVDYAFGNPGSATPNSDYYAFSSSAFIAPGETSVEVNFTTVGDTVVEPDEDATFSIVSVLGGVVGTATSTISIIDDDVPPPPAPVATLVGDVTAEEGDGTALVDLYLDSPATAAVTLNWTATPGSATSPADFAPLSGSITIPQGETTASIPVTLTNDTTPEPDESFSVALTSAVGPATVDPSPIQVGIADDDTPPAVLTLGANQIVTEGTGTGATVSVPVVLSRPASGDLEVFWSTTAGSATTPADFAGGTSSVIIPAGATGGVLSVPVVGDNVDEFNEQFTATVTAALGNVVLGTRTTATATITDDDATPTVAVTDVSATEGSPLVFTLTLSAPSAKGASVRYATSNVTAVLSDYSARSGTASFPTGVTTATVSVPTTQDAIAEPDETMRLLLSNAAQIGISDNLGIGTIVNDDAPPNVTVASRSIVEGNTGTKTLNMTVSLSSAASLAITATLGTQDVTAISTGVRDYNPIAGQSFTFQPGQTTKTISITIVGDRRIEPDETFNVKVLSVTGPGSGVGNFGVGTIVNND